MTSAFLFLLCLTDVVAASVLLSTGISPGVGVTMLVAGCLVSLVGVFTIVRAATPAPVRTSPARRGSLSAKHLSRN
ncbi:hypothetical protein [Cohnella sp. 56]|uniref:hypothetical protein n=1 Tax=Cohnella sp. 56 TaxID=3113722 RepID=UPI0030E98151